MGTAPILSKPEADETLRIYLSVSACSISSVLSREADTIQRAVYYVSQALTEAKTRYPLIEKLALALVVTARRLRPYFHAHPISNLTNQPLRQVLHRPEVSGRLIKWSIKLSKFHINYRHRLALKGQAMTDFIKEFTPNIMFAEQATSPNPDTTGQAEPTTIRGPGWALHVDGASNVHGTGAEVVLSSPTGLRWNMRSTSSLKLRITRQSTRLYSQGFALPKTSMPEKSAHIAIPCSSSTRSTIPTKSKVRICAST
ncbi:hypothetical protein L3X38_013875 [Prunus dulcis]|uniref:Reverse transcriptase RNase H-like domain-containing protein n=1 Tax=Prunus dulcis TaxID=3755 RepID=A0AAD4ZHS6_PRUDU|nr:hypothetical protein L3X38_013875 [Prunus dulcis]